MTHCAKCGAELIGTRKFCTACGTPAGDPRSPAASTGMSPAAPGSAPGSVRSVPGPGSSGPSIQYAPAPPSRVDPFGRTAGPATAEQAARGLTADYGPPPSVPVELATTTPGVGDPSKGPHVSPLATSNVDSGRGAFVEAMSNRPSATPKSTPPMPPRAGSSPDSSPSGIKRGGVPGTQLMPSMANPSFVPSGTPNVGVPSAAQPSGPGQKRPERTQLIEVFPGMPSRPGAPMPSSLAPSGVPGAPSGVPGSAPAAPLREPSNPDHYAAPAPPAPPPPHAPPPLQHAAPPPAPLPHAAPPPHMGPGVPLPAPQGWNPIVAPPPPPPMAPYAPAPIYAPQSVPMAPHAPPPPPAPGYGYGFGYAPGSRVTVTWSNGQRYPGTVTQVTGNQCLVVFPDGQHHWVDMQYLAPG